MKSQEDFINKKKKINDCINEPRKSWKEAKSQLYDDNNSVPDRMIENDRIITGNKNVANTLNQYYISKIRNIRENMKKC